MSTLSESTNGRAAEAVIFDLDGTLTLPYLDFDVIRREIGLPVKPRTPVLEALEQMTPPERSRAEAIIHRHEKEAARASELQEDALDVLSAIRTHDIPLGLLTRNSRRSAQMVLDKHGMKFDWIYTREDGPIKPSPQPVLAICQHFSVPAQSAWVVGDYLFDLQAGNAAGATTVLMIGNTSTPEFAHLADHVIRRLSELLTLLAIRNADS